MVGAVKGCLFRSIKFFSWNFQSQTWIFKVEMNACFVYSGKKLRIIFCYRNGGLVSEHYNVWGKSGEDLIKVVFDIMPVHPKTSTESSIEKQSQGTKPSAPEVKEPSLPDNPGHKPSSGPSTLSKFQWCFPLSMLLDAWLCQDGHGSSPFSTLQLSLRFPSLHVWQAAPATLSECPFHPLPLTPHSVASLLCLKLAVPSSASLCSSVMPSSETARACVCVPAGLLLGAPAPWITGMEGAGTTPLCSQLQHLPLCWQCKTKH